MWHSVTFLDVFLASLGLLLLKKLLTPEPRAPFPPGPKGLPLIGNALDMPTHHMWKTIANWSDTWGDIIYVNILGQPLVFLNSPKAAADLLDKKSVIYSDRPSLTMACELVGWTRTLGLQPFGDEFRAMRKLFHLYIGTRSNVDQYTPMQEYETHRFLTRVLDDPDNVPEAIRRTSGAIILRITYGYAPKDRGDALVDLVDKGMEQFSILTSPNAFIVDAVPILKHIPAWFPGAKFKRIAPLWAQVCSDMFQVPMDYVKKQMADGTAPPSFTSHFLEDENITPNDEAVIKWAAGSMYGGGADTTVSSVYTFFLTMTLSPEVQKRAQAEIDAVIGNERLPSLADREHLPYVSALVKEVFRWHPVVPLDLPHRLMEDDIHNGYLIPKGAIVVANIWKYLHDPETYANPMEFDPGRFLGENPEQDPRDFCFGFGRRICPGMNLADSSVWISCAMSLAVFDISKAVDEDGRTIEPEIDFTSATISHPKPFKCSIKPRSPAAKALILAHEDN